MCQPSKHPPKPWSQAHHFLHIPVFPASRVDDPPKGCLSRHGLNAYPLQEISSCARLRGVSPSSGHRHHLSLDLFPPPRVTRDFEIRAVFHLCTSFSPGLVPNTGSQVVKGEKLASNDKGRIRDAVSSVGDTCIIYFSITVMKFLRLEL